MLDINVPGREKLETIHLVCDINGTIAKDGILMDGIGGKFNDLRNQLEIHLLTADTHGKQKEIDKILNLQSVIISTGNEAFQKGEFVRTLGAENVVAIGQGANDAEMLRAASLGICVISPEGTAMETLLAADLVVPDIYAGLKLLEKPLLVVADLRK